MTNGHIAEIPATKILELFGKTFFEFCQDSGYDKILQVLGATPRDFLQVNGFRCKVKFLLYDSIWALLLFIDRFLVNKYLIS